MKLNLSLMLGATLLLSALLSNAQTELNTVRDVRNRIIRNAFMDRREGAIVKLGDERAAVLVNTGKDDEYAVACVSPDYQFKWQTPITGYPFCIARLGDKIIVVAATDKSYFKSYNNQYMAFLFDPENGKMLAQKEIYKGSTEFMEYPQFYTSDTGKFFKFSVRVTAVKRKVHVGLPGLGALVTMKTLENQANTVQRFAIVTVDEKLNTKTVDPTFPKGIFVKSVSNADGDLFVFTMENKSSFFVSRYVEGQKEASISFNQPLGGELKRMMTPETGESQLYLACDDKSPLTVYWTMMVDAGKGTTMLVSKINFADGKSSLTSETFSQDKLKELKKQFKEINKDVDQIDLGASDNMALHSIYVFDDRVLIVSGAEMGSGSFYNYSSEVISSFSKDLKLNYQLALPNKFYVKSPMMPYAHAELNKSGNVIRFISNVDKGIASMNGIYGEFNSENGQMLKLAVLPRGKKIDNAALVDVHAIIWTEKGYTVPFCELGGWTGSLKEVTVKQYTY
ncbi:hypothetical protein [Arcticibacter tournemirensis]|uniref:Uncharacterized protein n=1 Tax=Arcticibacter tournemirensis TaxID=699437 RepID=A0A4Q0M8E9_9SPHI|nr:hypothetical protein [Arcticibacter tournemirensis]RXF69374.1 hypothetical protein EKH83_11860 [Arcticibacter tournemirensis]